MNTDYTPLTEWFYAGQRVKFTEHAGATGYFGYGTIKKVAQKNYQVVRDGKEGWLNVPIASAAKWIEKAETDAPPAPPKEEAPRPAFGQTVRVDRAKVSAKVPDAFYIVFGWSRDGESSKCLPLNGVKDGRYWTLPNRALVPIELKIEENTSGTFK